MNRNYFVAMTALLLVSLLLVPSPQFADTNENARSIPVITDGLKAQLEQAGPDEMVTVIVKLRGKADLDPIRGQRGLVFSELRRHAAQSQRSLVGTLQSARTTGRVGVIRPFWIDNMVLIQATPDVIKQISERSDVTKVFENYTVTLPPRPEAETTPPGDPNQNGLDYSWDSLTHIGAKNVWNSYGFTGTGVRVGGLDTGVDINHPDITGKMITNNPADPTYPGGWAEFDGNGNIIPGSVPHDSGEHGTHTTGTMIGGNASGFDIGVAPGASLMHGLVIPGGSGTFAQVAGGMEWIIDPDGNPMTDDGAQVVNMSLGATGTFPEMVAPTDNMVAANVFPSFSIGNSGPGTSTTGSPGNVPSAFGVGATNSSDVIASFSSRGPVTWSNPPLGTFTKPDISAPGVDIFSSVPGGSWENAGWNGTSMAAPHVSGTVALIRQANPTLLVNDIKLLLAQTAIDLGDPGMDNAYGHGRVDCFAAVSAALAGIGTLQGTVYSSAGPPISGVRVFVTDTGQQVYTDANGNYSIQLVAGSHTMEYSAFGYDSQTVVVTIDADMTTTQDVTLNQLPSGYIAGAVTDDTTGDPIVAIVNIRYMGDIVRSTTSDAVTGDYMVTLPVGVYDVIVLPPAPYPKTTEYGVAVAEAATTPLDFPLSPAQILIVDDDNGDAYEVYFENAVATAGRSYITTTTPPTAAEMAAFEATVWFTGDDYTTTLTASDRAEIAAYLDGGGRMFITGQDIGYDIRSDGTFMVDYLHAAYVQDDVKLGALIGNPANPVGVGFAFDIKGGTGANNQAYASEVDPVGGAMTAFVYNPDVPEAANAANDVVKANTVVEPDAITSSGTGGLTFDNGTYRLVYFSFGFEAIASNGEQAAVMDRILDWLQGFPEIAHDPLGDTEDTEHPYEVKATITSDYFPLDPTSFAVVYDVGSGNMSVPMMATGNPDEWVGYIPAQSAETDVYYYVSAADAEGHITTHPLGAPVFRHMFRVGADHEPPTLVHIPHSDTNDLTGPYPITAMATDNIGIESVYLVYRKNGGVMHRAKMMMQPDGMYAAAIPGPSEVGDVYEYAILAMDESYSGNVTRYPESGYRAFGIVEEFVWDFEADDGQFTPMGDGWEWGAPTSGPGYANSGMNVWATILDDNYPASMNATLDLPQITLDANKPYAVFSFWHWYNFENRWDGGNIKVSADGGMNWDIIHPAGGYDDIARTSNAAIPGEPCYTNNMGGYSMAQFDLSAYSGQSIILRFHAGSDGSVHRPGWYVDDVRLRSTTTDDAAPVISSVGVPESSFDAVGPYTVTATIGDLFSGVDAATMYYSTDGGMSWMSMAMNPTGNPDEYSADIPGQAQGTRIQFYLHAADVAGNESVSPDGAPGDAYAFSILPSAPNLVLVSSTTSGGSLDDYRAALEANGHEADYWNLSGQGSEVLSHLNSYDNVIVDEISSMSTAEKTAYAAFMESGTIGNKKGFFVNARSIAYYTSNRPWTSEYLRADYVQNDAGWDEITGEPGDPIGNGETFVIDPISPDEIQRSATYPGGVIVYRYTGPGGAGVSRAEYEETMIKIGEEWDGVMPYAPISDDAAAGMRYNGDTYRSVYLTFNFDAITEASRRATIADRVLRWLGSPEIVHDPLPDTEDTANPYPVTAMVYSDDLDPTRVRLTYDVGGGPVVITMSPTGTPNQWMASIPAQPLGTTVSYYLSAANNDGNTSYDPPGAPGTQHTFYVTVDEVPPVITHVPVSSSADVNGPYLIEATVTDNAGVDTVELSWRKNGGALTTVAMTTGGGDVYSASIPGPSVLGDVYEYYILASDIAAVPNLTRSPTTGYHSMEIVDFYAWDFEASDGGFSAGGPDWEWGAPTTGPGNAHSGVNVWATKLGDNYVASSNSTLDLPAIVVPTSGSYAQMTVWQWYYIETNYDGGNVKISTDGGTTWDILYPDIGYNGTARTTNAGIPGEPCFTGYNDDVWHQATFNLTPYRGQAVMIRFHFGSDGSVQRVGWYIDDIRIEPTNDNDPPAFASVDIPGSTFDETGPYPVTAVVTDALAGIASLDLHYSTDDGATWTTMAMMPTGNQDEYSADIPGQPSGTRIKHYLEATDGNANTSTSPDGAPAVTYEFGIMPSGDFLVLLDGCCHTDPVVYQTAFANLGRSADIIDYDDIGNANVTVDLLESYQTVIIDHSFYFVTAQIETLSTWLDRADGSRQRIIFYGDDFSSSTSMQPFMEQYSGLAYVKGTTGWNELKGAPGDPISNGETFITTSSSPEELAFSTLYPGAQAVFRYSGAGPARHIYNTELELKQEYEKYGLEWDPRLWPLVPDGPDSLAAGSYVGPNHNSVRFAFQFEEVTDINQGTQILDRALDWIATATVNSNSIAATSRSETPNVPDKLVLNQNYPNPFNPTTHITIGVPNGHTERISLKVYNVRGQLVANVFDGTRGPGYHTFQWNGVNNRGSTVSSGIYFARMTSGQAVLTRKMVMLK